MDSYVIYPNGERLPARPKRTRPSDDERFSVTQLQDIVGGYIGILDVDDGLLIYNDDGPLNDKPINVEATRIAQQNEEWKGYIAGPAIVCARGMIKV